MKDKKVSTYVIYEFCERLKEVVGGLIFFSYTKRNEIQILGKVSRYFDGDGELYTCEISNDYLYSKYKDLIELGINEDYGVVLNFDFRDITPYIENHYKGLQDKIILDMLDYSEMLKEKGCCRLCFKIPNEEDFENKISLAKFNKFNICSDCQKELIGFIEE